LAPEAVGDALIDRLRDYLGPRVRVIKAEISRDALEVELESLGWRDEATRLAKAARDLYQKGARRNALSMCAEALALDSLNAEAMTTRGMILEGLERYEEALDAYTHAREFESSGIGSSGIEVMLAMTRCALRLSRMGTALQYVHEALRIDPRNSEARRALRSIKRQMGAP
jgi:Flp pilus assembly protein TadD